MSDEQEVPPLKVEITNHKEEIKIPLWTDSYDALSEEIEFKEEWLEDEKDT